MQYETRQASDTAAANRAISKFRTIDLDFISRLRLPSDSSARKVQASNKRKEAQMDMAAAAAIAIVILGVGAYIAQ